jgi:hypothetical protein
MNDEGRKTKDGGYGVPSKVGRTIVPGTGYFDCGGAIVKRERP